MRPASEDDEAEIDALTAAFFAVFSRENGAPVSLASVSVLFIEECRIVKAGEGTFETYSLPAFIEPRERLLNGPDLTHFREHEVSGRTQIYGNIAQRFSLYRKEGVRSGEAFEAHGAKTFQFVRTPQGWKIGALAWYDQP